MQEGVTDEEKEQFEGKVVCVGSFNIHVIITRLEEILLLPITCSKVFPLLYGLY